jgi:hypothetical protein
MKQVIEKKNATNQETHFLFVDLTKAYDSLPTLKFWEVLRESNINNTLIKALQNLYGNTAQLKIGNKLSHPFSITKGLHQVCWISTTLFKTYITDIEKKRLQWYGHVKRMPEERIPKLIMEWIPLEKRKEDVQEKHGWKE